MRKICTPVKQKGERVFCAPYCMMALTGKSHEQVCTYFRKANGWSKTKVIQGLWEREFERGFKLAGFKLTQLPVKRVKGKGITLARWLDERRGMESKHTYLISSYGHMVLVSGNQFIDTRSKVPVHVDDAPWRRMRVERVYRVRNK